MLTKSIEALIPHWGIMLLLDRVVQADEESIETEYTPRMDAWYADPQGDMPAWVGMELKAQTIAAWVGWLKQKQGLPPKRCVLLGTRHFKAETPIFKQGVPFAFVSAWCTETIVGWGRMNAPFLKVKKRAPQRC